MRLASFAALALLVCTPAFAQLQKPGSVLVYPVHHTGGGYMTCISVTNTNPLQSVILHFEYVNSVANAANPLQPLGCVVQNRAEILTPSDTLSVLTACHTAVTPGGQSGYLVVSALGAGGTVAFDHLVGSELVMTPGGGAWSIDAIALDSPIADGMPTDVAPTNGRLDFNGLEYAGIPDELIIDSFVAMPDSRLALVALTGGPNDIQQVQMSVWNDNEYPLSTTLTFRCWFDQPLTAISGLFTQGFLASTPDDDVEIDVDCDGDDDVEAGWLRIDSLGVHAPGGFLVSPDGALLGAVSASSYARLPFGSAALQGTGSF